MRRPREGGQMSLRVMNSAARWIEFGKTINDRNRITEEDKIVTPEEVRRATVYAREDLVSLMALLIGVYGQLRTLKNIVAVLTAIVGAWAIVDMIRPWGWWARQGVWKIMAPFASDLWPPFAFVGHATVSG